MAVEEVWRSTVVSDYLGRRAELLEKRTVETPCHQHFNDEEDKNSCNVILHSQDIRTVLEVQETPECQHQGVQDGDAAIEWQLGDLCSRELSIGVPELDKRLVLIGRILVREHAVVASVLDLVLDWGRFLEMDGVGEDNVLG